MTYKSKVAAAFAVLAIGAMPALAIASTQTAPPGHGQGHHGKPVGSPGKGDTGNTGPTGHKGTTGAYGIKPPGLGKLCQGESKKHVKGQKGTPFSQCVTALAHLRAAKKPNPAKSCSALSKKHVKGMDGTPYSECVSAAAKLLP